jgi:periplasmic copper chaperone A
MPQSIQSRCLQSLATHATLWLLLAMGSLLPSVAAAQAASGGLNVENPSMRFIIKARPAAGYFTLKNNTGSAVDLTGASSNACGMLMLHQSKEVNGVEEMRPVKTISVPAHGAVHFEPGGYHLMCMSPRSTMKIGASVPVTLKFAGGQTVTAQFSVQGPGGATMGKMNMGK